MTEHEGTRIGDISHNDTRTNNPTQELRNFCPDDEKTPQTIVYPRDPSLDPQLVWKGKDQQCSKDLEVDALPIYIQETIKPRAIIEDIRATGWKDSSQTDFFSDSEELQFEELIDFYQHERDWSNRMILGDSLLVMNSLAEKERLKGQVQMIYIDPPYGIRFGRNWQCSTRKNNVTVDSVDNLTRQPEQIKAYRDTWEFGIHSYLSYLRDRLMVARELLTEHGSAFVQIGDANTHLARSVMDEVFGSENFIAQIAFRTTSPGYTSSGSVVLKGIYDILLWYAKDVKNCKYHRIFDAKSLDKDSAYSKSDLVSSGYTESCTYDFEFRGKLIKAKRKSWRTHYKGMKRLIRADRLINSSAGNPYYKQFHTDYPVRELSNLWNDTSAASNTKYVVETSTKVIQRCLLMTTDPGDLVLDPTCGGGTTAYVAEQWGRRWITIDTSRVALALARTRLMSARYPYYILADSQEGALKEAEMTNDPERGLNAKTTGDIKKGFVYRRVPHIKLSDIANNLDIDEIHANWQEQLEPLRARINSLTGENWEEWEVPPLELAKVTFSNVPTALSSIKKWWEVRQERQTQIDDAIARHSEPEILYDKPYECIGKKKIRVTGPFTVESLSPHSALPADMGTDDYNSRPEYRQFAEMIIENLKRAGAQNGVESERLYFDSLESFTGERIDAVGTYSENDETKRVAVSIVPQLVTIGAKHIKEAVKEAVRGMGFDLLIVCGFAFDSSVADERTRYGTLTVLTARMNTDLTMGNDVLKKTGTGNLFIVFGEPDVHIDTQRDGKIIAEVRGVDGYNPVKGTKSFSTDDIACWFIDTNYNDEAFFVRHAYFTGADEPYENLKKALKAEINEEVWDSLYTTRSRPFDKPNTGKIAVKVINHYGDEVLKVYNESCWKS